MTGMGGGEAQSWIRVGNVFVVDEHFTKPGNGVPWGKGTSLFKKGYLVKITDLVSDDTDGITSKFGNPPMVIYHGVEATKFEGFQPIRKALSGSCGAMKWGQFRDFFKPYHEGNLLTLLRESWEQKRKGKLDDLHS